MYHSSVLRDSNAPVSKTFIRHYRDDVILDPTTAGTGLTYSSGILSINTGNGLTTSGDNLVVNILASSAGTGVTASYSGLEFSGSALTMLQGCSDGELLQWNESTSTWRCTSVSGVGAVDGSGTGNYLSVWSDSNTLANSLLYQSGSNIGIGLTNPSYQLQLSSGLGVGSTAYFANLVGIGTTLPGYNLQVEGSVQADSLYAGSGSAGTTSTISGLTFEDGPYIAGSSPASDNYQYWTVSDGVGTTNVTSLGRVNFSAGTGISTALSGGTLTIPISATRMLLMIFPTP